METSSRSFFFVATLSMLLVLAGGFIMGHYSGRIDSLAKLGLCFGGVALLIYASAVYKKKGIPDIPR